MVKRPRLRVSWRAFGVGRPWAGSHGIAFEDVLSVFGNREALALEDKRRDYGEPRYVVLCPLQDVLVHVTYTVRGGSIRLISARRASRRERRDYERRKPDQSRADPGRPRAH